MRLLRVLVNSPRLPPNRINEQHQKWSNEMGKRHIFTDVRVTIVRENICTFATESLYPRTVRVVRTKHFVVSVSS